MVVIDERGAIRTKRPESAMAVAEGEDWLKGTTCINRRVSLRRAISCGAAKSAESQDRATTPC